jgi:hypothetical protein
LRGPTATVSCDPWTIHSLTFFLPGHQDDEMLDLIRSFRPAPMIFDRNWTDRQTGEVRALSYFIRVDFARGTDSALLPLGDIAASLQGFPWALFPGLTVNRLDLASDHLVSDSPREVCDRIAALKLPYSRPYRRPGDADEEWFSIYHNGGKARVARVAVIHYPRLESLLYRHPDAASAAVEYCRPRVRQEIRFRGRGLRDRVGPGSMTSDVVLGSFAALVRFAERRLRPVFREAALSVPGCDLEGERTLARMGADTCLRGDAGRWVTAGARPSAGP